MKLRFVNEHEASSAIIQMIEGEVIPFTPSHVDIVLAEGYCGARNNRIGGQPPGVYIRPVGYDASTLDKELIVDIPLPTETAAEAYVRSKIGTPYDWPSLLSYSLPVRLHQEGALICSAFATMALRYGDFFLYPLCVRAHEVSPRDLMMLVSSKMKI
jgi:hypothetical protein